MTKGAATRESVVDEALRQATTHGLAGLSFGGLADELGRSKSGLFAHFKGKEALQLAVLEAAGVQFGERVLAPALAQPAGATRLLALFRRYLDWMSGGCLYSTVAQELDQLPEPVAAAFRDGQRQWQRTITRVATDAVGVGGAGDIALEFVGLALAFQQAVKVFHEPGARRRVVQAFERRVAAQR